MPKFFKLIVDFCCYMAVSYVCLLAIIALPNIVPNLFMEPVSAAITWSASIAIPTYILSKVL